MTALSDTWSDTCGDTDPDTPPPPGLVRIQELHDLRAQGVGPYALHTMTTVPTQEYL